MTVTFFKCLINVFPYILQYKAKYCRHICLDSYLRVSTLNIKDSKTQMEIFPPTLSLLNKKRLQNEDEYLKFFQPNPKYSVKNLFLSRIP